ncbi:MAG: hypothetical protein KKD17_05660 [Nanoarchaeota archaeon]|nr:hypothetical protein [Nanoarchaeota archaeon]
MAEKRGTAKHKSGTTVSHKSGSKKTSLKHRLPGKAVKLKTKLKSKLKSRSGAKDRQKKKRFLSKIAKPELVEETIKRAPHELEEEFFVPSPIHRGKYRIPLGIRFLIGYLGFLSLLYIISFVYGITFPTTILFGKMISGSRAMIINAVLLAIILFMVYGFWKRKAYTFDLSIGFFSFTALNATISLLLFESAEHPLFKQLLLLSFVSLVIMDIVIIWYILHERKYFYAEKFKDRPFHHRDKVFLYTIITFWTLALLIGITIGVQFYKDTTRMIDSNIAELKGDYYRGQLLCEQKSGPDRDVCTLVVATALSAKQRSEAEMLGLCNSIQSDFYRFTCMRSIAG